MKRLAILLLYVYFHPPFCYGQVKALVGSVTDEESGEPVAGAIVQARIPEVYIGCMNPKAGCAGSILNILQEPAFNHQVEVVRGVCEEECSSMLSGFFAELREKKKRAKSVAEK